FSFVVSIISNTIEDRPISSAVRKPTESYVDAWNRELSRVRQERDESFDPEQSAYAVSDVFENVDWSKVSEWQSLSDLVHAFEFIRDARFLELESAPDFLRRISWLYPDDGCF